jgi:ABC-type cobalamin/Fe3+-siderophores transport system ATPase subunit
LTWYFRDTQGGSMQVRKLEVRNFRGVRQLDWSLGSRFICLIGCGDSSKSTLLDAVALVLDPRWNVALSDSDFFGCDVTQPIEVTATVTGIPNDLMKDTAAGRWLRGVAPDGTVHDEPLEEDEAALTIRFSVSESLEPKWELIKDAIPDERRFSAHERELLGVAPVGTDPEMHLKWIRGSALSRTVDKAEAAGVLAAAFREARQAVFVNPSDKLDKSAEEAAKLLTEIGGAVLQSPRAGLDPGMMRRGAPLVLHDGDIPANSLGTGSKRLAALALQLAAADSESIVLVDEIEFGLEPHRLLHVLRLLKERQNAGTGQVFITTHSPLVIEAVKALDLWVTRAQDGNVTVMQVPDELDGMRASEPQATVRSGASAMLARRIVVCEGKTEVGMCRALVAAWDAIEEVPMALVGTAIRNGCGNEAPRKARCLAKLGYDAALLVDDDLDDANRAALAADVADAVADGVALLRWQSGCSVEEQVIRELPESALADLVALRVEFAGGGDPESSVRDAVADKLGVGAGLLVGLDPVAWAAQSGKPMDDIRSALALAAKKGEWFKDESRGERFGQVLVANLADIDSEGTLAKVLAAYSS